MAKKKKQTDKEPKKTPIKSSKAKETLKTQKSPERFVIYTDRSANNLSEPHYGGSAFVVLNDNQSESVHEWSESYEHTTNNRCEIIAFLEAVKYIQPNSFIEFHTDSQYCQTVLNLGMYNYPKNMDLISDFREICRYKNIQFKTIWVKGHAGNKWNERADKLANDAYEKISGEKQIDYKDKKQVWNALQKRQQTTINTLKDSIKAHFQYHFSSDSDLQTIFDSVGADDITDMFLDWAINNASKLEKQK